jgi:hypothetical protein
MDQNHQKKMMKKTSILFSLVVAAGLCSFAPEPETDNCYINFKKTNGLKVSPIERLADDSRKTSHQDVLEVNQEVAQREGYRISYSNKSKVPFVSLEIQYSSDQTYSKDTTMALDQLKSSNMMMQGNTDNDKLIELHYNGYLLHGVERKASKTTDTAGTFVMFPEPNITVFFYFWARQMNSGRGILTDLQPDRGQRNAFLGEYTGHLKECANKKTAH